MDLYSENDNYKLYQGDMLDMLEAIEPETIDSIITDPPYELNFMGKGWDNAGVSFQKETWEKCFEVLKPGGYLLAFGGSRTFHRIACAIEDAGFEIRDTIMWLYGAGFPKSMNVGKQLEKRLEDEKTKQKTEHDLRLMWERDLQKTKQQQDKESNVIQEQCRTQESREVIEYWNKFGTALKPSFEPIIVARKPFKGSLVDNVIEYGIGGINIDECRVEYEKTANPATNPLYRQQNADKYKQVQGGELSNGVVSWTSGKNGVSEMGRFPANTILTYDEIDFDEVCGGFPNNTASYRKGNRDSRKAMFDFGSQDKTNQGYTDSGSASRYFYCAKASKKDRDEGLDEFELKGAKELLNREENSDGASWNGKYSSGNAYAGAGCPKKNTHPTVKPTELMQYLVRLVTPNGGIILDPFNGSGSTGKAVMYENKERNKKYKYIGIELTEEYLHISKARIEYVCNLKEKKDNQTNIFDFIGSDKE